jgi:hypothetical protein
MARQTSNTASAALIAVGFLALGLFAGRLAVACPFCQGGSQTLTKESEQAAIILFGRLANAKLDPNDPNTGTTDLIIETVVKAHDSVAGKQSIVLPRYIVPDKDTRVLVFCDFYQGKIDPYRCLGVRADSPIANYLKGALAVKDKDTATRLRYFLNYLEDKDPEVSGDAYNEFGLADYKEFRPVAEKAPADVVAKWITDPNTAPIRLGLYGSILGHCGKPEHAPLLRRMLEESQGRSASGIDGLLAGYIMLDPKGGWAYLQSILNDEKRDFLLRYAVLRTARFFRDYRPDVIKPDAVADAVAALLDQKDIADMAVEELRKWGEWRYGDRIFAMFSRPGFQERIIRRAILRYALSCPPGDARAAEFIAARKKEDAQWVDEVAELLRYETPRPDTPPAAKK